jgi:hypothetical protein
MVALGQEFSFPIDFSMGMHAELSTAPGIDDCNSKQLTTYLSCCWAVAKLLVKVLALQAHQLRTTGLSYLFN